MENPLLKYLAFVKTVEKGSFTKAAEDLHYAQSSVSKTIADLEVEWGMTLLERSKSGVVLTSAGEQLVPYLRKALCGYDELAGQILRIKGTGNRHRPHWYFFQRGDKLAAECFFKAATRLSRH